MPAETLAEQVSELIWMEHDNRKSMKGFVYNDGSVDPGVTLTEFMKEAHEVALQLLSEFPEINLADGEYLLEDNETEWVCDLDIPESRWTIAQVHPDDFIVLQRPYDREANDLIIARNFPTQETLYAFIEEEIQEAIHQEFRAMTSATGPKATGWYRQRSDTNIHKIGIIFDGLDLVPDDSREFDTEAEAVAFLKEWQAEMSKLDAQDEERRRRAVD